MSRLLSIGKVAERLEVSAKSIRRWVEAGEFPPPTHILPGGTQRWSETVVDGWLALKSVGFTVHSAPPVKGKKGGTTVDNRALEGTNLGGDGASTKPRL